MAAITLIEAVTQALAYEMKHDPSVVVLGEDVGVNGGVFLGLNGIVIKSHGGTDEVGYTAALGLAYEMARSRLIDKISEGMSRFPLIVETKAAPEPEAKPA